MYRSILGRLATLLLAFGLVLAANPADAASRAFTTRFTATANGDVVVIGNTILHCNSFATATTSVSTACQNARAAGTGGTDRNNDFSTGANIMTYVDVDADATTFSSSSATLAMPPGSTVLFAGLYWAGRSSNGSRFSAKLKVPGSASYQTLTATQQDSITGEDASYQGFINVTSQVQLAGAGQYTVADVRSSQAGSEWAGWQLVVAYSNPASQTRNLNVIDGWQLANGTNSLITINLSGFLTPVSGPVNSTLGLVVYDGDRGTADTSGSNVSLRFGPTVAGLTTISNAANPATDVYNSTISSLGTLVTNGVPNWGNTLGVDIDTFSTNVLPNSSSTAVLQVRATSGDVNYPAIITLAIDVFVPNLTTSIVKSATDVNGDTLLPGEEVLFTISSTNTGNDTSINNVLTDNIPANMTYVPGSLVINSGANAGAKTDAAGDDQAEVLASPARVVYRLGTGATASAGGTIAPTAGFSVSFRATVNAGTANGTTLNNTASLAYRGQTLPTDYTATASASATLNTAVTTTVSKDNGQTEYTPGVASTYTIVVGNSGPAAAHGTVVRDTPPAGMSFGTLTCTGTTGGAVCPSGPAFTVANLSNGTGITIATFPPNSTVTLQVTATVN